MRLNPIRESGWNKVSKELVLLITISLLVLLTAGYAGASWLGKPAGPLLDGYSFLPPGKGMAPERVSQTNYALQFDGSDDFARVVNTSNLTTTFTLEAWV